MAKSDLTSAAPDFNSVRSFRRAIADDVCENSRELFFGFTRGFVKKCFTFELFFSFCWRCLKNRALREGCTAGFSRSSLPGPAFSALARACKMSANLSRYSYDSLMILRIAAWRGFSSTTVVPLCSIFCLRGLNESMEASVPFTASSA